MDEIHNLKIRTYENKLIIQKSQLQYFQIQLKPHFYLNCLKTLYGMIQQNKGNDAQQMILYVSQYIRYTFRDNSSLVPLQTELNQVQNYYKLQKLNTRDSSELTISADPAVSKFPVPCSAFRHSSKILLSMGESPASRSMYTFPTADRD